MWHKDDNYRDSDGNECEAVDKVSWDGTIFTIYINNQQGKDEIEIYEEEGIGAVEVIHSGVSSSIYIPIMVSQIEGYTGKTIAQLISEYYTEGTQTTIFELNLDVPENHNYGRLRVYTDFSPIENEPVVMYDYRTHRVNGNDEGIGFWRSGILANGTQATYGGGYMDSVLWTGMDANGKMPIPDPLPFDLSFTLSSIAWDQQMNQDVYNSYSIDRS